MSSLAAILIQVATGFAVGGLFASLHQLMTRHPASFHAIGFSRTERLWAVLLIVFGGPFILMRNAIRGRVIEGRPASWLAASTALATSWSFASGVCVLQAVIAIRSGIGA